MLRYLFLLFVIKTFFLLDIFINIVLTYLLVKSESFYLSDKVNKLSLFLIPGVLIHNFTLLAFTYSKFLNQLKYADFLVCIPYILLSLCTIYIGIVLYKNKEFLTSVAFTLNGWLSMVLITSMWF